MSTFYIKDNQIKNDIIIITGEDVKHIKNVLRYKINDMIDICDDKGTLYSGKIIEYKENEVIAKIEDIMDTVKEPDFNVTLFQGIPKGDKMELIVQKCTELGISKIVPLYTDRVIVKFDNNSAKKKVERWNKIAKEASKQCGRQKIPIITEVLNLKNIIEIIPKYDIVLVAYENETDNTIKQILQRRNKDWKDIAIVIGPEGGFSESDINFLRGENVCTITLGPRILRTETAGLVTLAILMYELEG